MSNPIQGCGSESLLERHKGSEMNEQLYASRFLNESSLTSTHGRVIVGTEEQWENAFPSVRLVPAAEVPADRVTISFEDWYVEQGAA